MQIAGIGRRAARYCWTNLAGAVIGIEVWESARKRYARQCGIWWGWER